ncbi:DUF2516 family protein [Cellulomonas sp. HZM]|uniref:DUF2516 family protein n=1 Tax=Cellulomonas sp. HZM TaxID=1454010 RepID=UPI000493A3B4|nr:DUF2516 family protein [Cellulomonas sp. HZM]
MIATVQVGIYLVFMLAIFLLCVWALIDLLRRPSAAFVSAGKRTKGFWGAIIGVSTAVSFAAVPFPKGIPTFPLFLALLCAVAAIVYLVDVRPALGPYSRRGPRGPRGPQGPSRGGW